MKKKTDTLKHQKPLPHHGVLHIVYGEEGEYSSYRWWVVAVYLDKARADEHLRMLREEHVARCKEMEEAVSAGYGRKWSELRGRMLELDADTPFHEDTNYDTTVQYLTEDPRTFRAELSVLMDLAKEKGWIPT